MNKKVSLFAFGCLVSSLVASTVLSPNQNQQSGVIPSGYSYLEFNLSNGDWAKQLRLPNTANDQDVVILSSDASYEAFLDTSNIDLPFVFESFPIQAGSKYKFVFNKAIGKWSVSLEKVKIINDSVVQQLESTQLNERVYLEDGAWVKKIVLPPKSFNNALILIESDASHDSSIDTSNLLFASNFTVKKGDQLWFRYVESLNKWIPEYVKPRVLNVQNIGGKLDTTTSAVTEVQFGDGNWVANFELPVQASDRDRIIVSSVATWQATISNKNINTQATLKLNSGDRYEFIFDKDISKWVLISSPQLILQAKDLANQQIPDTKQPVTRVKLANANWQAKLALPIQASIGDKVIVDSTAGWNSSIEAANGLKKTIQQGETQRYIYTNNGWKADSSTIDMLLVNSSKLTQMLGASAAKLRMLEGMDLTNIAAENSNAQFYIRNAGYLEYKIPKATTIFEALDWSREDKVIQGERDRVKADAVYYEGDEKGCGVAYWGGYPNAYNMVAVGSIDCDIYVMRHEFGHNMGLDHHDEPKETRGVGRGFKHPLGSTIMAGNDIPYFSSPLLYHPKYGYRLGIIDERDGVSIINKNAEAVSKFR